MLGLDDVGALMHLLVTTHTRNNRHDITHLLANHVDRVLNTTVRNNGHNRGIHNTEVLDTMDAQLGVNNTLVDACRQTCGTARV